MFLVNAGTSPLVRPRAIDLTRGIGIASGLKLSPIRLEKSYASGLFRYINVLFYNVYRSDTLTLAPLASFSCPSLLVLFSPYSLGSVYNCLQLS